MDKTDIVRFQQSLDRATADPQFLTRFYERFLGSSREVAAVFAHTDMERLKRKLKASLHIVALAAEGDPGTDLYLGYLGRVHERMNIRPEYYEVWIDSLMAAVAESDPQFDAELEAVWRAVIRRALQIMLDGG